MAAISDAFLNIPYKYWSLVTLVVQNSTLVIVMRYSRLVPKEELYSTATAVFMAELIKLALSLWFAIRTQIAEKNKFSAYDLYSDVFAADAWKLMIPAALYTVQNNLQYIAVSFLDAATFQVTYQLKILTTALFSVLMLKRTLSGMKWISLVILTIGVALVSLPNDYDKTKISSKDNGLEQFVGLGAVSVACVLSGIAGVYFEKVLKEKKEKKPSVWVRNIQLSFFSLFPALVLGVWWKDGNLVSERGFFYGYSPVVWSVILCQAIGGLIVAMVVKYADNILKGFATSISIILSFIASVILFAFPVTLIFLAGCVLVLVATYMYSQPDVPKEYSSLAGQVQMEAFKEDESGPKGEMRQS
ncbi:5688_t:CDS:1 [Paraglomus occultum]|uniref:5688_t:CDS:1 n=1 Tax=Paraglomus occultum TaxID=144539 RepID=A0A9N9C912_9GLOM|nr:5688_t:CDS:1 [Paraglomus occultum]